jgi:ArsR family transcriptional regulator
MVVDACTIAQPIEDCEWVCYHRGVALRELPVLRERGVCCELPAVDAGWAECAAAILKALADPNRLPLMAVLWRARAPVCICDFTASLDLSQPTISHHMGKLKAAGLVAWEKQGIWTYYRVRDDLAPATRALLAQLLA